MNTSELIYLIKSGFTEVLESIPIKRKNSLLLLSFIVHNLVKAILTFVIIIFITHTFPCKTFEMYNLIFCRYYVFLEGGIPSFLINNEISFYLQVGVFNGQFLRNGNTIFMYLFQLLKYKLNLAFTFKNFSIRN